MDKYNRRHSLRQSKDATIQVVLASDGPNGRRDRKDLIPAKMSNQSDEGLYIEIDHALMPGSNVRINMVSHEGYHPEEAHRMLDGRVIWCEKIDNTTSRFGAGIKILRKIIQAPILTSRFK